MKVPGSPTLNFNFKEMDINETMEPVSLPDNSFAPLDAEITDKESIFFWDMTPCSALSGTRRFGGTYRLHLQGRRIFQESSEQASGKPTHYTASYPRRRYSSKPTL
jgi:hypothetical protein